MPRTKVHKSSKRNREKEDIMHERLREFDAAAEQEIKAIDERFTRICEDFSNKFNIMKNRLNKNTLKMTLNDLFTCGLNTNSTDSMMNCSRLNNRSYISAGSATAKDDGYLTEDSTNSGTTNHLTANTPLIGRTPGPLASSKVRSRRSRSACGYLNGAIKINPPTGHHKSRPKLRTPQPTPRGQAFSVDRGLIIPKISSDSPPALYRWPKLGEKIFSSSGSPVVVQGLPLFVANVNIPIRDGMLSLRPKKLDQIDKSFVEKIESNTLEQIKQLQYNLSSILKCAEQSSEY